MIPATKGAAIDDARPSRGTGGGVHVAETAAQNSRELETQRVGEIPDLVLRLIDHVAARFGVLSVRESVADRPHAPAQALAGLDDRDGRAHGRQVVRRRQAGKAGARDEHCRAR